MFDSKCVREKSNVAKPDSLYKFSSHHFEPPLLLDSLPTISPKAVQLMEKIAELDKRDLEESGKLYKHFIFCDVKSRIYGLQFLASCFIAHGYTLAYNSRHELTSDEKLLKTKNKNFYLLSSLDVYDKPLKVNTKKTILKNFNRRPENVHGRFARFILMDAGFKEGVDLFDIKYIHIFEIFLHHYIYRMLHTSDYLVRDVVFKVVLDYADHLYICYTIRGIPLIHFRIIICLLHSFLNNSKLKCLTEMDHIYI
jgi:hypothetical protein